MIGISYSAKDFLAHTLVFPEFRGKILKDCGRYTDTRGSWNTMIRSPIFITRRDFHESPYDFTDSSIKQIIEVLVDAFGAIGISIQSLKGKRIVIKPNLVRPGREYGPGVTTDPRVVAAVCAICRDGEADDVLVGDDPGWGLASKTAYTAWDCEEVINAYGGRFVPFDDPDRYVVHVSDNVFMRDISLPGVLRNADVFINIPKMKTHILTGVSLGIKNLHGLVCDDDRMIFHRDDVEMKLVDILSARPPDITVVDGIQALEGQAPLYGKLVPRMNTIITGANPVATDAVAATAMGFDPESITHLREARRRGLGSISIDAMKILGGSISDIRHRFMPAVLSSVAVYEGITVIEGGADSGIRSSLRHAVDRLEKEGFFDNGIPSTVLIGSFHCDSLPVIETPDVWLMGDRAGEIASYLPDAHRIHFIPGDPPHIFDFYHAYTTWLSEM